MNKSQDPNTDNRDITSARNIDVFEPGANMLWVKIDWGDKKETIDIKSTPQNRMLFDRDQFTFNGKSLYSLLFGDEHSRAELMKNPYVAIKPGPYDDTYRIWFNDKIKDVLTSPDDSQSVLDAVVTCTEYDTHKPLKQVYEDIKKNQVNRNAILNLLDSNYINADGRIEPEGDGLVIDDYFLLTWEAKFYVYTNQWKEGAFTPSGNPKEKPGQFRKINVDTPDNIVQMELNGVNYQITELEWVFMRRLNWILNWRDNIDEAEVTSIERTVPILQNYDI